MASPPKKKLKVIDPSYESPTKLQKLFEGLHVLLIEDGIGKARCSIFEKQLLKHGANLEKRISDKITHILVSKKLRKDKLLKILKLRHIGSELNVLDVEWVSQCLVKGCFANEDPYRQFKDERTPGDVNTNENSDANKVDDLKKDVNSSEYQAGVSGRDNPLVEQVKKSQAEQQLMKNDPGSSKTSYEQLMLIKNSFSDSSDDEEKNRSQQQTGLAAAKILPNKPTGVWACATPSSSKGVNYNAVITDKLAILEKNYTSTQERWRSVAYKKAITSIKNYHKPLETYEEVCSLPFVGDRLAKKIWEIIETGHLRRLDHIDPKVELLNTFSGVWGAGPKTAEQWVAQGFTSLDDLRDKAELNFQQKIGLKYYNEINERMPREEVTQLENIIRETAKEILPNVLITVCGSYRRGRSDCGDIDLLVSHPDNKSHQGFLIALLDALKKKGLITDDLITVQKEEQRKYMGLIKLPEENSKHRRIDFIVAPFEEWPCALMHFTGSAHFNRSIRLLAKKKNMSLSEHGLRKNVVRNRKSDEKVNKGTVVPVKSEKDIFEELGLDYLEPTDRDW